MAELNFPASPSLNQTFTQNGLTYIFDGITWVAQSAGGGGGASIALTANTTDANTYYVPMANSSSGTWSNGVIDTDLTYNITTSTMSTGGFTTTSDINLKDNVTDIIDPVAIINCLHGVEFNWKSTGLKSSGVIAQETQEVLPHLIVEVPSGYKTVNYDGLLAYVIEAIKQIDSRLKLLEGK